MVSKDYHIQIKAKNAYWYERAKDFPSIKDWDEWDDEKTPRYLDEITFKFTTVVSSFEPIGNSSFDFPLLNEDDEQFNISLSHLRLIKFNGGSEQFVIISESILEQVIAEKAKGKDYIYCYIKEYADYHIITENIWLSEEHLSYLLSQMGKFNRILNSPIAVLNKTLLHSPREIFG